MKPVHVKSDKEKKNRHKSEKNQSSNIDICSQQMGGVKGLAQIQPSRLEQP